MLSTSPRRRRKDRLSISLVPEDSLNTTFRCAHLRSLFSEDREMEGNLIIKCDSCEEGLADSDEKRNNNTIVHEVTDWLELTTEQQSDLGPRTRQRKQCLPYAGQLSRMLAQRVDSQASASTDGIISDEMIHFVALQLLASCYTLIPGLSAECLPISQQRTGCTAVSALRLHLKYRSCPAAGHHARNTSETSSWPGLYAGPSLEDRLAETISRQRQLERTQHGAMRKNEQGKHGTSSESSRELEGPMTCAPNSSLNRQYPGSNWEYPSSGWSDGPASPRQADHESISTPSGSSTSTTTSLKGLLDKLIRPKSQQRKMQKHVRGHFTVRHDEGLPFRSTLNNGEHHFVPMTRLYVPPEPKLRRTQSAPRKPLEEEHLPEPKPILRRTSSTPAPVSHPEPNWIVPTIRRISATTLGDNDSTRGQMHAEHTHWNSKSFLSPRLGETQALHLVSPLSIGDGEAPTVRMSILHDWLNGEARRITPKASPDDRFWRKFKARRYESDCGQASAFGSDRDEDEDEDGEDECSSRGSRHFRQEEGRNIPGWRLWGRVLLSTAGAEQALNKRGPTTKKRLPRHVTRQTRSRIQIPRFHH